MTGSSRGIGRAIALRLAEDGYDVCVNDVAANEKGCQEVAKEIQGKGRKSCVAVADVTKRSEVAAMIQTSVKELGDLNTMYGNDLCLLGEDRCNGKSDTIVGSPTQASHK